MELRDIAGIFAIGVILFLSSMIENPEGGKDMLSRGFGGIKDFVRWLNSL